MRVEEKVLIAGLIRHDEAAGLAASLKATGRNVRATVDILALMKLDVHFALLCDCDCDLPGFWTADVLGYHPVYAVNWPAFKDCFVLDNNNTTIILTEQFVFINSEAGYKTVQLVLTFCLNFTRPSAWLNCRQRVDFSSDACRLLDAITSILFHLGKATQIGRPTTPVHHIQHHQGR